MLDIDVTAAAEDSTLARVVELVEQAQAAKAPVQQLVDRFSRGYTPIVVVLALVGRVSFRRCWGWAASRSG